MGRGDAKTFCDPPKWRYGIPSRENGRVEAGYLLRRLLKDHNTPCIRLPREEVRHLGWNLGELLFIVPVDQFLVIGKLNYEDPTEVAHDIVDEVRRKFGNGGPKDDQSG